MRRAIPLIFLVACSEPPAAEPKAPSAPDAGAPAISISPVAVPVPVPVPEKAAYDLAADRDRRLKTAKDELGGKLSSSTVSDVFVVVGPPGGTYDSSVALFRNAMTGYLNGRFDRKPSEAITVYLLPNTASYEDFCKKKYEAPCIAHFGFYQPNDRYMVMNIGLGLGTLTHEIVHPLVESDFPAAPTWINEGIASVFEQPQIPKPGEIHGGKNWRLPRLRAALTTPAQKSEARLDHYFGMKDDVFRGDFEDLHYAAARYICQWLDERGKLWSFYHRWRDTALTDPTGEKAFTDVVGLTPADAHPIWAKWVLAL